VPKALRIAERMQPENGGYEEAIPLTGFVAMSLAAAGEGKSLVVRRAAEFLAASTRDDGSWPIDSNLSTWVTTLSVKALTACEPATHLLLPDQKKKIRKWLLDQQHNRQHPLTYGAPGGWAWTELPGGMPDADDTPGVLIALRRLGEIDGTARSAAARGANWLIDLRNSDGGTPTFARGWGKLPFDRSCPDVTAHTLWALSEWRDDLPEEMRGAIDRNRAENLRYLRDSQRQDGSWIPLWFGNQWTPGQEGPVYGTARVVDYLNELKGHPVDIDPLILKGRRYLIAAQNSDGGWGGTGEKSSIEETALAIKALLTDAPKDVIDRGLKWLADRVHRDGELEAAPIGLYFAKLWYSERLYPVIFALDALAKCDGVDGINLAAASRPSCKTVPAQRPV
jgi:squalene-hopene/tetraprenyl-beta-curcumene cyclase